MKDKTILERAIDLLMKIRYCKWPTSGLGIGLTAAEIDDILVDWDAEVRLEVRKKKKLIKARNEFLGFYD